MKNTEKNMIYRKRQMGGNNEDILQMLAQYAQSKGINPDELINEFQQATPEQQQEFLQQIMQQPQEMQYGGLPISEQGQYEYPNQPVVVPTRNTGRITMRNVPSKLQAFNADTMEYLGLMEPEKDYQFEADNILEVPVAQYGNSRIKLYRDPINPYQFRSADGSLYSIKKGKIYRGGMAIPENISKFEFAFDKKGDYFQYSPNYLQTPNSKTVETGVYSSSFPKETNIKKKENTSAKYQDSYKNAFVTGLKPITTRKDMLPVYKDSWVEEWSAVDPNFKKKSFAEQQKFARDWTLKNTPDYYQGMKRTFKDYDVDKLTQDKKFGSITNQLRPINVNPTGTKEEALPVFTDTEVNPTSNTTQNVDFESFTLPTGERVALDSTKSSNEPNRTTLGKLSNRDYYSSALSNAKMRSNRVLPPYFRRVDLDVPQLFQEDVRPYLSNITRQTRTALQNINPNSTTGQAVAQQLASNAAFQSNTVQGQVTNRNLERQVNWANQVSNIRNQQEQMDDAFRMQYTDDWSKLLANKDTVDNAIDFQAAELKAMQQRQKNQDTIMAAMSSILNPNYDLSIDEEGEITYGLKNPAKFQSPTKTAKYGIKRRVLQ